MTLGITSSNGLINIPLPAFHGDGLAWHYTSAEGLTGIISKSSIWMSSAGMLNDTREIAHGVELFLLIWNKLADETAILPRQRGMIDGILAAGSLRLSDRAFVLYASKDGDSLSQWRSYGRNDGYALGFATNGRFGLRTTAGFLFGTETVLAQWRQVIYEPSAQERFVRDVLDAMLNLIPLNLIDANDEVVLAKRLGACLTAYLSAVPYLKDRGFHEEQEVRLCIVKPEAVPDGGTVQHRVGQLGITPYCTLTGEPRDNPGNQPMLPVADGSNWLFPIARIRVGPVRYPEAAEKGLRSFLDSEGYTITEVKRSSVPYR